MINTNFTPFPHLSTERLNLRPLEMSDDEEIFFVRADDLTNKYLEGFRHKTIEETQAFIKKIIALVENNQSIFWVIAFKDTNELAGTICLWNISKENSKAEAGYVLHPHFKGKGIMNEALEKVIEFGFQSMKLKFIEAYTHRDNISSIKFLERNNFKRIADKVENSDDVIYSLSNKII